MFASILSRSLRCARRPVAYLVFATALLLSPPSWADRAEDTRDLVNKARETVQDFKADPDMTWFRDNLPKAKAVLVVPVLIRGGFIVGGSGGHGTLLWRDAASGSWSYPGFYFMGSISIGLQIGGEAAEVVLMAMSDRGREAFLSTEFKLGADVSVAAGPVGAGAKAATADVLAFSRDKGLFGGITVEGAVIEPEEKWNKAYYGRSLSPTDILMRQSASNPHADPLRQAIAAARAASVQPSTSSTTSGGGVDVALIQRELAKRGYDPGPADGVPGPKTRDAIRQYERDAGMTQTGQPSAELQRKLTGS